MIFTSTVDVYNKPASRYPYTEDEPRDKALGSYGQNKVKCEDVFSTAHERGDFAVTIIRPAMTYGEGGSLVQSMGWDTRFVDRIRRGKPIICHGDGSSLWVACHVDDAAAAFAGAIGSERAYGKPYHVTGEEWMTWDRYYQGIAEALGAPAPELVHIPSDLLAAVAPKRAGVCAVNFQFNNIFDNSPARSDLGFRYSDSLGRGRPADRGLAGREPEGRQQRRGPRIRPHHCRVEGGGRGDGSQAGRAGPLSAPPRHGLCKAERHVTHRPEA